MAPKKLGINTSSKKKAGPLDKYIALAKKNAAATVIIGLLLVATVTLMLSSPRTEEQARLESFVTETTSNLDKITTKLRANLKPWDTTAAKQFWTGLTPWQRHVTTKEVCEHLKEKDLDGSLIVLKVPDMGRLFQSNCPDVNYFAAFGQEDATLWKLYDGWKAGNDISASVVNADSMDDVDKLLTQVDFFSGMDTFSEADKRHFSKMGWMASRSAMLGRFFLNMKRVLAEKASASYLDWPEEPEPEPDWKDEPESQYVAHLTLDDFDEELKKKTHALIMFYAPWCGHCKKFKPDYNIAARLLVDHDVVIGAVDATKEKKLGSRYTIEGFPTIYYFRDGEMVEAFDGLRTKHGIIDFFANETRIGSALAELAEEYKPVPELAWADEENDVVHLTDSDFDSVTQNIAHSLVMFYAPWCGHCKAFKPDYGQAASMLKGEKDVIVAAVDATIHKAPSDKFDVKGFPTIVYLVDGEMVEKYNSERTAVGVYEYLMRKMGKTEL